MTVPGLVATAYAERAITVAVGLALIGIGVACLGPSLLALLGRLVPPERRGLGVGALQVSADIGGSLGPLIGSALFTGATETPYLFTAAVNAMLLPIALWLVRASRRA